MRFRPIVLATQNPHKVHELQAIFAAAGWVDADGRPSIPLVSLADAAAEAGLPLPPEPAETGLTFQSNAAIKARTYAAALRRLCLADDSGLEVDALGGAPGVISSHYATSGAETGAPRAERDKANNARLLAELAARPGAPRHARFVCCMALADEDGHLLATTRGTFEGRIGEPPRVPAGHNGFGYDPLFLLTGDDRTSAELPDAEKNARSHRGQAAREMARRLHELFAPRH